MILNGSKRHTRGSLSRIVHSSFFPLKKHFPSFPLILNRFSFSSKSRKSSGEYPRSLILFISSIVSWIPSKQHFAPQFLYSHVHLSIFSRICIICLSLIHISEPTRLGMISYA